MHIHKWILTLEEGPSFGMTLTIGFQSAAFTDYLVSQDPARSFFFGMTRTEILKHVKDTFLQHIPQISISLEDLFMSRHVMAHSVDGLHFCLDWCGGHSHPWLVDLAAPIGSQEVVDHTQKW